MTLKSIFDDKKVKKELIKRIKSDNSVLEGLKNSLIGSIEYNAQIILDDYLKPIGFISAEYIDEEMGAEGELAFIYYYIVPEQRRKGYGSRAIKKFAKLLQEEQGIEALVFSIAYENYASIACVKKLGAIEIDKGAGAYTFIYEFEDGEW